MGFLPVAGLPYLGPFACTFPACRVSCPELSNNHVCSSRDGKKGEVEGLAAKLGNFLSLAARLILA